MTQNTETVVSAQHLAKQFKTQAGTLDLFQELNLEIKRGESVAIVGHRVRESLRCYRYLLD